MSRVVEVPEIRILDKLDLPRDDTVVLVIDMQNDFVDPRGKLYVPGSEKIIENIKYLISEARRSGVPIIYTQDWHRRDDPEFRIWSEHAVAGTWGAEIVDSLRPSESDYVIKKIRYDAFYGTELDHLLSRVLKRNHIFATGVVANICVLHTLSSAALRYYNIATSIDSIAALNEFDLYATLRQIDFLYKGSIVRSVRDVRFI